MNKVLLLILFCAIQVCVAQNIEEENTDILLKEGIALYQNQKFEQSLAYANKGILLAPDYHDLRVLRIRIFQALDRLEEAKSDLKYLLNKAPEYYAVRDLAIRQVNLMNYEKGMILLDEITNLYEDNLELKVFKAQLLFKNSYLEESRKLAQELINSDDLTGGQRYQLNNILNATVQNELGVNYQYFRFGENYNREDWQNFILEYQHNIRKTTFLGRVTHSNRGFDQGQLYELDVYPVINEKLYFYGNIGGSSGTLFPNFKTSASVFYSFIDGFEAEAGGKLLNFNENNYLTGIFGLTHYLGKFYLNLRAAIGPKRLEKTIQNYQFNIRYYYKGSDNFVFTRLSRGISPDESSLFVQVQENPGLEAYFIGGGINFQLGLHHIIRADAGLLFEDINPETSARQQIFNIGYRYRF